MKCAWCHRDFAPGALDYVDHHDGTSTAICEQCLDSASTEPDPDTALPHEYYEVLYFDPPANDNATPLWCA